MKAFGAFADRMLGLVVPRALSCWDTGQGCGFMKTWYQCSDGARWCVYNG